MTFGKEMKIVYRLLAITAAAFLWSCAGSDEAKTRREQELEFTKAFGFSPSSSITTIRQSDLYRRGLLDGGAAEWLSFTFEQATFDKIIQTGYNQGQNASDTQSSTAPSWWPSKIPQGVVVYSRSQDDTPEDEGFQFREYIWHDITSGFVYFHKSYWD